MTTSPRDAIVEVLEAAQSHDNRNIDANMVDAWLKAARLARWPSTDLAKAAVDQHYAFQTERIMPGHVTQLLRKLRSGPATMPDLRSDPVRGISAASGSSPEHRARLREALAAELEARNVASSVKARVPWHDGPVREDVDDDALVITSTPEERRALMHAIKGKPARGVAGAFSGRPG